MKVAVATSIWTVNPVADRSVGAAPPVDWDISFHVPSMLVDRGVVAGVVGVEVPPVPPPPQPLNAAAISSPDDSALQDIFAGLCILFLSNSM